MSFHKIKFDIKKEEPANVVDYRNIQKTLNMVLESISRRTRGKGYIISPFDSPFYPDISKIYNSVCRVLIYNYKKINKLKTINVPRTMTTNKTTYNIPPEAKTFMYVCGFQKTFNIYSYGNHTPLKMHLNLIIDLDDYLFMAGNKREKALRVRALINSVLFDTENIELHQALAKDEVYPDKWINLNDKDFEDFFSPEKSLEFINDPGLLGLARDLLIKR